MLLLPSEDGNPMHFLGEQRLADLLQDPQGWGVDGFTELSLLPSDPNYWPTGVAVLIRFEVVVPEAAGAYRLPVGLHE